MKNAALFSAVLGLANIAATAPIEDIVGGTTVGSATTYPWSASLQHTGNLICEGTIISRTKVLTAAYCVTSGTTGQYTLRVGSLDYTTGGSLVSVASVVINPNYTNTNTGIDYDVAVMTLSKPLTFSSTISAATLPRSGIDPTAGKSTIVIGWGLNAQENGYLSRSLQQITIPVLSRATCNSEYNGVITERMFCAYASGKDACTGDGGGPIINATSKVVLGGVSFAAGCAKAGYAGVYSNYANPQLHSWITSQL